MKQDSSTKSWNNLGDEWIELAQTGESRIVFIMPYMLELMGDVHGQKILDLGCGEGGYSRELAKRGAAVTVVDCSEKVLDYASSQVKKENLQITHYLRNSNDLYVNDLVSELKKHNTALLTRDNLWDIADEIKTTSLNWPICRMDFAKERNDD